MQFINGSGNNNLLMDIIQMQIDLLERYIIICQRNQNKLIDTITQQFQIHHNRILTLKHYFDNIITQRSLSIKCSDYFKQLKQGIDFDNNINDYDKLYIIFEQMYTCLENFININAIQKNKIETIMEEINNIIMIKESVGVTTINNKICNYGLKNIIICPKFVVSPWIKY